jgi:4-diphosphocytidyl-2-C-methyl-D-erythritol kinase
MICFPNAKINLGLHITGKRDDGFHNIETLFYPVALADVLEVIPLSDTGSSENLFSNTGRKINAIPLANLCLRAWSELAGYRSLQNVQIHLHKIIPVGSGLGGGSSNAAFMLKALNELFELKLSAFELASIAGGIGSDCPFFIHNTPLLARERGDVFEPVEIDLSGIHILIAFPGIDISTAWAYREIKISGHDESVGEIIYSDPHTWQDRLTNDFESRVFDAYPLVRRVREKMLSDGAFYSSMTGSGSAVYGLFDHRTDPGSMEKAFPGIYVWEGIL